MRACTPNFSPKSKTSWRRQDSPNIGRGYSWRATAGSLSACVSIEGSGRKRRRLFALRSKARRLAAPPAPGPPNDRPCLKFVVTVHLVSRKAREALACDARETRHFPSGKWGIPELRRAVCQMLGPRTAPIIQSRPPLTATDKRGPVAAMGAPASSKQGGSDAGIS